MLLVNLGLFISNSRVCFGPGYPAIGKLWFHYIRYSQSVILCPNASLSRIALAVGLLVFSSDWVFPLELALTVRGLSKGTKTSCVAASLLGHIAALELWLLCVVFWLVFLICLLLYPQSRGYPALHRAIHPSGSSGLLRLSQALSFWE